MSDQHRYKITRAQAQCEITHYPPGFLGFEICTVTQSSQVHTSLISTTLPLGTIRDIWTLLKFTFFSTQHLHHFATLMNFFLLLLLLAPLAYSHSLPTSHQAALVDPDLHAEREKEHRIFYLRGDTGTHDLPKIANATLELWANRVNFENEPEYSIKKNISNFRPFAVRNEDGYTYGRPLI
ncbi:hypothetical protein CC78DRAFT_586834 [Lojkania enalia]|uniref:Uncharacterized protein n=1 Tax=Lojkania enalia TaxID=147567 RepID=A0A9P4JZF9_9PLEO|nr:hypothetical protein CC78DRAFT_586834 [Didymosphaeria enalia]